jgi:phosphatidylserine/phosphatidylglycerophosphate/cardiolipin synthase-like enzyme
VRTPISTDFTIASAIDSVERLRQIATAIAELGTGDVTVSRDAVRPELDPHPPLESYEAEALFVGLLMNDVASKDDFETPLADATFVVDVGLANRLFEEQLVAKTALAAEEGSDTTAEPDEVEFVATLPSGIADGHVTDVRTLDVAIRSVMLAADDVVRIANPYFDPGRAVVETMQALPRRGVETRILTRRIVPSTDRYDVLATMRATLSPAERDRVEVAELSRKSAGAGPEGIATHAKMVLGDDDSCYIGSANFTATSMSRNFEVGTVFSGTEVALGVDVFDAVFDASRRVLLPRRE